MEKHTPLCVNSYPDFRLENGEGILMNRRLNKSQWLGACTCYFGEVTKHVAHARPRRKDLPSILSQLGTPTTIVN